MGALNAWLSEAKQLKDINLSVEGVSQEKEAVLLIWLKIKLKWAKMRI